ncbi:integral membrane protein 2C-like [Saccoglossus kowalevskii]|uniref:Integral membrane protein 2 n=1 Tax=Saccoglossus kowalevskii TaxID=10224 RepID=A0ABM0GRN3_SACKO|nr:PREDICTED: integral membrane protein 2C-like [Saccoglossus kowalevskii]
MVKPSVYSAEHVKKDDDLKKEKDTELPPQVKVVPDDAVIQPATAPPRRKGCCTPLRCCLFIGLLVFALVGLSVGVYILVNHYDGNRFTCGVTYDKPGRFHDDYSSKEDEDGHLDADIIIDPQREYEQIEQPENDECERITIMHDYTVQLSAYRLWSSNKCYVKILNQTTSLNPQEFWEKLRDPNFFNQHFQTLVETYLVVLPRLEHFGGLGLYIPLLCQDVDTYWLEKVSTVQMDEFMNEALRLLAEVMGDMMGGTENIDQQPAQRKRRETTKMLDDVITWAGKSVLDMQILKPEIAEVLKKSGKLPDGQPSIGKAGKIARKIAKSMPKHAMRMKARNI